MPVSDQLGNRTVDTDASRDVVRSAERQNCQGNAMAGDCFDGPAHGSISASYDDEFGRILKYLIELLLFYQADGAMPGLCHRVAQPVARHAIASRLVEEQ